MSDAPQILQRARDLARGLDEVADLYDKYLSLERLAQEPAATEKGTYARSRQQRKRLLAQKFPGSLRELDQLSVQMLADRSAQVLDYLERLVAGEPAAPEQRWIPCMVDFHRLARAALILKRLSRDQGPGVAIDVQPAAAAVGETPPLHMLLRADRLERIRKPPRGRVLDVVYEILAEIHGVSESQVRVVLFGQSD